MIDENPRFIKIDEAVDEVREYIDNLKRKNFNFYYLSLGIINYTFFEHTICYCYLIASGEIPNFLKYFLDESLILDLDYATEKNEYVRKKLELHFKCTSEEDLKFIVEQAKKRLHI